MPKVNRCGQASVWTESDLSRFLSQISNPKHWLFVQMLIFTGERVGAICQVRVMNCSESLNQVLVREYLIFPGQIRNKSKKGQPPSREVPVHNILRQSLKQYPLPNSEWLFPSPHDFSKLTTG